MYTQLFTRLLTSKLAMTDHIIRLLPKETREKALAVRRATVLSVKATAEAFLQTHEDKPETEERCSAIPVD